MSDEAKNKIKKSLLELAINSQKSGNDYFGRVDELTESAIDDAVNEILKQIEDIEFTVRINCGYYDH